MTDYTFTFLKKNLSTFFTFPIIHGAMIQLSYIPSDTRNYDVKLERKKVQSFRNRISTRVRQWQFWHPPQCKFPAGTARKNKLPPRLRAFWKTKSMRGELKLIEGGRAFILNCSRTRLINLQRFTLVIRQGLQLFFSYASLSYTYM